MNHVIRCECGFIARGDSDEVVISEIKQHMQQDHPALFDEVGNDDLRSWVEVE